MNEEAIISMSSAGPGGILLWGIELIKKIQLIESPGLTAVIKFITALGSELFYIPVLLFFFWCVDEKKGFRFMLFFLSSAWVNGFCKVLFRQPRPYNLDPSVGRASESSYGFPSGHAQLSLCFWFPLGFWAKDPTAAQAGRPAFRKNIFRAAAVFIILLIAFTRLYLGLHFPTDILGGWFLGALCLLMYYFLENRIAAFLTAQGVKIQLIAAAAAGLAMNALYPEERLFGGVLMGFAGGYILMRKNLFFSAAANVRGKKPGFPILVLRYVLGIAGAMVIYFTLDKIFPGRNSFFAHIPAWGEFSPYHDLGRFILYGITGLWIAAGAPWVFLRLGLAGTKVPEEVVATQRAA